MQQLNDFLNEYRKEDRESLQGEVVVIFDCDEWKSCDSMRMIMVSDTEHLEENLEKIKFDHEYSDEDMNTYIYMEFMEINTLY